jgi:hypothetical protein
MEGGVREGGENSLPRYDVFTLLLAQRGKDRLTGDSEKGYLRQGNGPLGVCSE